MDKRTILAVVLCIAVWLIWQALFGEPPKPAAQDGGVDGSVSVAGAVVGADGGAGGVGGDGGGEGSLDGGVAVGAEKLGAEPPKERPEEKVVVLKNEFLEAVFSTRAASLKSLKLLKFKDVDETKKKEELGREDLVSGKGEKGQLFQVRFKPEGSSFVLPVYNDWEVVESSGNKVAFRFSEATNPAVPVITKTFLLNPDSYVMELDVEVQNRGSGSTTEQLILDVLAAYSPPASSGCMGAPVLPRSPSCLVNEEVITIEATPGTARSGEPFVRWTGINEQYFLAAVIPRGVERSVCSLEARNDGLLSSGLMLATENVPPGGSIHHRFRLFTGPKQLEILEQVKGGPGEGEQDAGLKQSVDFGWLAWLCLPMLWLLKTFYSWVGNYGIAIIFLTIVFKVLMWPLTQKQMKSMRAMAKLKPLMDDLKKRVGDDKQKYQEELLKLYKTHGVSPFTGCLPMLLQMPIWIALYRTLYSAVELYQSSFIPGWIDDLSYRDPYFIMPVVMGVAMFLQQKLTPTTADSQQAKMMMYFMPIFFTFIMLYLPAGLVLYIFVSSGISVANQLIYNKKNKPGSVDPQPKAATT